MDIRLTDQQHYNRDRARQFATDSIQPWASQIDQQQTTPICVLTAVKKSGYLGAPLPKRWGGGGIDAVSYGLVTEEIGKTCSSVRSLMTVHNMSAQVIAKIGSRDQQTRWLPDLCAGRKIIVFALTEPKVGSATHTIETEAAEQGNDYVLNGIKKWITYGQIADLFLVFAHCRHRPLALIVDRRSDGVSVETMNNTFGVRGSMLAEVHFENVIVPKSHQLGQIGAGISFVANSALDHGRFSVAWGSTGIIQACLEACVSYANTRTQGNQKLIDYQLVRRQLTDMLVAHTTARALCYRSGCLRESCDPRAVMETAMAKYYASDAAIRIANDAVHMHGANGCSADYPVSRYLRDATVMGIIEGTHEIHQLSLASYASQRPYLDN
jgi:alkylation response protein AidB-like acyl-CoA dehydrogenase